MEDFLWKLLELSLQAGLMTLLVLGIRRVFRKIPANYLCVLWMLVGLRLFLPFSFETDFAPMRSLSELITEQKQTFFSVKQNFVLQGVGADFLENVSKEDGLISETDANGEMDYYLGSNVGKNQDNTELSDYYITSVRENNVGERLVGVLFSLWIFGMALIVFYGVFHYVRVKNMVKASIFYKENIWFCEGLEAPFLFGFRNPKIYIPCNLEEEQIAYVVRHEMSHLERKDNYSKLVGYAFLAVYWFQPLVWLAYVFFCRDIERACDERAISDYTAEERKGYAEALLFCSVNQKFSISNPLAFGEADVKNRIQSILQYKKPKKLVAALSILLCAAVAVGCSMVRTSQSGEQEELQLSVSPTVLPVSPTTVPITTPEITPLVTEEEEQNENVPSDELLYTENLYSAMNAIPMGESVTLDLNGDGKEETVQVETNLVQTEVEGTFRLCPGEPNLKVTDASGKEITFVCNREDNPDVATWYLFDLNVYDGYWEIGVAYDGPSKDPVTYVYRYIDGEIKEIGSFETTPLEVFCAAYPFFYGEELKSEEEFEERISVLDRTKWQISVPGDGTITGIKRVFVLETSVVVFTWKLQNALFRDAALVEEWTIERLATYEFLDWEKERPQEAIIKTKKAFMACKSDYIDSEPEVMVSVPEGSEVTFVNYCLMDEWGRGYVKFLYSVEERWDSTGWLYITDGMICLPDGFPQNDVAPDELFEHLSHAG